jgi:hypothetical protein
MVGRQFFHLTVQLETALAARRKRTDRSASLHFLADTPSFLFGTILGIGKKR